MTTPEERRPRLYRVKEVARELTMSERHIARLIATNELPVVRFGRAVRISSADVDALIARCRTP